MRYITDVFVLFSEWMRDALIPISMAIVATTLVIFGNDLNKSIRSKVQSHNFLVRLLIFTAICAVGYGALTIFAAKILCKLLGELSDRALSPVIIITFIVIGFLAEHRHQM